MAARKSVEDSLRASIDDFVADLTSLFRDSIMTVVSGQSASPRPRHATRSAGRRGKRVKREPKVVAALTSRLAGFIAENHGMRIEQIARELGVGSKDLVPSVKELLAQNQITTRGQGRATTYFPARGAARRKTKTTPRRKARKKTKARRKKR